MHLPGSRYAVIGPGCNAGATLTASLTSNNFRVVQVSYAAETPLLSNIDAFPLFYRTVPSYLSYHATIAAVMQHFDWLHVGVIHEVVPYYTVALESLYALLSNTIPGARLVATQGLNTHLTLERTHGVRVFIAMAPESTAALMLCAAYHLGMTGPSYQWILLGDFVENWWKQTTKLKPLLHYKVFCSEEDMRRAIESTLIFTHHLEKLRISRRFRIIQGQQTIEEFWSKFTAFFNTTENMEFSSDEASWVPSTYDAVWSIALALNKSLIMDSGDMVTSRESNLQYTSDHNDNLGLTVRLSSAMETLDFQGASGRIVFTPTQRSQLSPVTCISQMQNGRMVSIGIHDERDDVLNLSYYGNNLSWQEAAGPPRDRPKVYLQTVDPLLVIIMLVLVSVGIVLCGAMAFINCYYRKHKVIKASSPYINMLIITGCFMGFTSVIFLSAENIGAYLHIAPKAYPFLCNARPWLLSLGYTLAFGALFVKTWRIYSIFHNPWKKNRPLKDHCLIAMVGIMLGVDLAILALWVVIGPLDLHTFIINKDIESFTQEKHVVCSDGTVLDITGGDFTFWILIVCIMKGLLLLLGLFLVYQTRKIKAEFFQDAKYTGIAIYGVSFCCVFGVPTALFLMYYFQEDPGYIIATATIIFCSYLILFMVFVPKIVLLKKYKKKIPVPVLLGLNPSFRVRSHTQYRAGKMNRTQCRSAQAQRNIDITESARAVSVIDTNSQTKLGRFCSYGDYVGCILDEWEPAIESSGAEHSLEECEREVHFEGISYIANVTIDKELPSSGASVDWSTGDLRKGTAAEEECRTSIIYRDRIVAHSPDFNSSGSNNITIICATVEVHTEA